MKEFTILSIDDKRIDKKNWINSRFINTQRIFTKCVDGKNEKLLKIQKKEFDINIDGGWKLGELGVWFSNLNAWKYASENDGLLIFEDDAIPVSNFEELYYMYLSDMPQNVDFVALWIPENQLQDYQYDAVWDKEGRGSWGRRLPYDQSIYQVGHKYLSKAYQGYGSVCIYVTRFGGKRLLNRALSTGINTPVDCFYFQQAHGGYINGYALKPEYANIINYDWSAETTIHTTEWKVIE